MDKYKSCTYATIIKTPILETVSARIAKCDLIKKSKS